MRAAVKVVMSLDVVIDDMGHGALELPVKDLAYRAAKIVRETVEYNFQTGHGDRANLVEASAMSVTLKDVSFCKAEWEQFTGLDEDPSSEDEPFPDDGDEEP